MRCFQAFYNPSNLLLISEPVFCSHLCHDETGEIGQTKQSQSLEKVLMTRRKSPDPLSQKVKGILILQDGEEVSEQAFKLMESLNCEVLTSHNSRMMIAATLSNIQSIKKCWLSNNESNALSRELNQCIAQIIIGGRI